MDAYERALFNCRLGTQNAQGLKQYFFPLAAGYWRAYNSPEESFWCCTGTESNTLSQAGSLFVGTEVELPYLFPDGFGDHLNLFATLWTLAGG